MLHKESNFTNKLIHYRTLYNNNELTPDIIMYACYVFPELFEEDIFPGYYYTLTGKRKLRKSYLVELVSIDDPIILEALIKHTSTKTLNCIMNRFISKHRMEFIMKELTYRHTNK